MTCKKYTQNFRGGGFRKRTFSHDRRKSKKRYLALVFDESEPTETLINICHILANAREIHVAFITDQPLEAPLRGFQPNQPNLLNAIQTWINEIE
ncbi:hypothetical protein [Nostoc sp. MS1]|uniref:NACHT C-terminal alpha/beta 1 domain-containing protein n=1 Tax=Nostoc sp. MS1 TaxID=2764711 RepID=UPI00398C6728